MKTLSTLLMVVCIIFPGLTQQYSNLFHGSQSMRLAYIYSHSRGVQSCWNNPAGLVSINNFGASISADNKFEIPELTSFQLALANPTGENGAFGLSLNQFGTDVYIQQKIGLSYARKLLSNLSAGLKFDFLHSRIIEYGKKNNFTFEFGLQSQVSKDLLISFHLFNPIPLKFSKDRSVPSIMALGFLYAISPSINLVLELEKNTSFPVQIKGGISYQITDIFGVSFGLFNESTAMNLSSGFQLNIWKNYMMDFAVSFNQNLGLSSGIGIEMNL